jgi:UDP:flavonoid glycosyltransferase YjiC (YdhE family)
MSHLGAICFPGTGHLNPMLSLARALQSRGHRVTIFQIADVKAAVEAAGVGFVQIGAKDYPLGKLRELDQALSRLRGLAALRFTLRRLLDTARMVLRDAPEAMAAAKIDGLLVDQAELSGGTIAERLGLPWVTVIFFPPIKLDPYVPPFILGWKYGTSALAQIRNAAGNRLFYSITSPTLKLINEQRRAWGLPLCASADEFSSKVAQIAQMPAAFDFPRKNAIPHLHHTGPFVDGRARRPVEFAWERLNGKRLIYASMGSLQNGFDEVFRKIAQACAGLDAQLVLSLGGGLEPEALGRLPGEPIVVKFAPQLELLQRASLTITHAGLNTTLESLTQGVPMVAIPVGNDQPGVAARIDWTQTGRVVPLRKLSAQRLRGEVETVLRDGKYRAAAQQLKEAIGRVNGLEKAADLVEEKLGIETPLRNEANRGESEYGSIRRL